MKVRYHDRPHVTGTAIEFNTHATAEVLLNFDEGDATSEFIRELDVQLPDGNWKPMKRAFADKDIIPDNTNSWFGLPTSPEEKQRGWI